MKVGVIGGGQLGRMLALAGTPLGMEFSFLDPAADACAAPLGQHLQAAFLRPPLRPLFCALAIRYLAGLHPA